MRSLVLSSIVLALFVQPLAPTTSIVIIAGANIKASSVPIQEKYKRKDCPVCKGKGWYISGDGIKKVECGYCEPDTTEFIRK